MGRSEAAIQADITAVQESLNRLNDELANVQPRCVAVRSRHGREIVLQTADGGTNCLVTLKYTDHVSASRVGGLKRAPNAYLNASSAGELRDWLNYHFPKETS